MSVTENIIRIRNVTKVFQMGSESIHAVDNVSLNIHKEEVCCLFGKSGSGKSTLLNLIAGLEKPTEGRILFHNKHIERMNEDQLADFRRQYVGFVFQSYHLLPTLTALENVTLPLIFKGVSVKERNEQAMEMLEAVGLADRANHKPFEMSGGQQQRVSIARAFVNRPPVVFADEPTGNLDTKTTYEMMDLITGMAQKNHQTLVIVTHDQELAEYADRIVVLQDGKIEKIQKRIREKKESVYEVEAGKTTKIELQVKNKGTGTAENVNLQPRVSSGVAPFRVKMQGNGDLGDMGANAYKKVTLQVTVDGDVQERSYSLPIEYTYSSRGGSARSGSMTIYLKMKGFDLEPGFAFRDMKLSPEDMSPGSSARLSGRLMNTGGQDMYQVELSLDNLTTEGISLTGGFNSKMVSKIPIGGSTAFQFPLVAAADMAAGNYPVAIKLKYRDQFGKNYEKTNQFYVNVGGVAGRKAILEIRNMQEPGGTYGVNQNFTVSFDLKNTGAVAAKDIVVTAEGVDSTAVVPKSASMKNIQSLAPGSSASLSFTFAGTSQSATQNQAIQFTVEYTSGGTAKTTFKQYAGVNISNPSKEGEENTSKPKIIVSNYSCDPLIVMAGQEFDLNLTLMNTHKQKAVKNIKMYLTLAEETSSETQKSGNIFTPVNSSNTFYFDSIRPKGTVNKALRLYVVPEAQPKTYTLTVNFEYEDAKGTEYTATELLGINVKQVTELQIDDFTIPETVEQGMPVTVGFNYYNTGKVTLNNVMIKVEGNVDCQNKNTYVGNMESGSSDYFETTFTPYETGEVPVSIVITYEDPSGETVEQRRDMIMQVTEPAMPDDTENPDASAPMDKKHIAIGLGLLVILAGALAFFVKNQKEPPKSTAESVSSAEDLEDDFEEDDFVEEVTEVIHEDDKEGMSL